ncbi:hypothetical protein DFQ29_000981 [Apophysomyces sp. BC1021]|nr:hypothetical protein DFQ29_000981 [Apophysomyces sp. BC1021]
MPAAKDIIQDQVITDPVNFAVDNLPASFRRFLEENDIDPLIYTVTRLPRFVRWNTHVAATELPTVEQLREQLQTDKVWEVPGMSGFFGFELCDQRLVDIPAYKDHKVFGIDLSSAVAVEALEIDKDDHVLDLCCAPGAKLCMIANLLGDQGSGTVTGVDLAAHRLATCRSLLKKYRVGARARLFEADGTTFSVWAPSRLGNKVLEDEPVAKRAKRDTVLPFWAPKILRYDPQQVDRPYDKVLVDAECTHDGSISHIIKYEKWGWDQFEKNFMDPDRLTNICQLQRDLMKQGWAKLKEDGIMVYSTCSLTLSQNEENVAWFLEHYTDAVLEKVPLVEKLEIDLASIKEAPSSEEILASMKAYCVRFDPLISRWSSPPERLTRVESVVEPALYIAPDSSQLPRSHVDLKHTDSFILQFSAFGMPIVLKLHPNDDLFHPEATTTIVDTDGKKTVERLYQQDYRIYKGHAMDDQTESWARIAIRHDIEHTYHYPLFEGVFLYSGDIYHIQTRSNFRLSKRQDDPLPESGGPMVIYRDSDITKTPEETSHRQRRSFHRQGFSDDMCAMEELSYNRKLTGLQRTSPDDQFYWEPEQRIGNKTDSLIRRSTPTQGCPTARKTADCSYVKSYGGIRYARIQMINDWNTASAVYERTFNISLGLIYLHMSVPECPQRPIAPMSWNQDCSRFYTINNRLSDFSLWRGKKGEDGAALWHLMTKCATGVKVGIAWLSQLCETQASQQIEGKFQQE